MREKRMENKTLALSEVELVSAEVRAGAPTRKARLRSV